MYLFLVARERKCRAAHEVRLYSQRAKAQMVEQRRLAQEASRSSHDYKKKLALVRREMRDGLLKSPQTLASGDIPRNSTNWSLDPMATSFMVRALLRGGDQDGTSPPLIRHLPPNTEFLFGGSLGTYQ